METTEKRESTSAVQDVIKHLLDKNPEGGEINLTDLEKKVPNMTRTEIIRNLRKSNTGAFVTGRRGKPSRFVYGAPAIPLLHKGETPVRQQISPRRESSETQIEASHGIELRVKIGDQITTIPITLELGVAA